LCLGVQHLDTLAIERDQDPLTVKQHLGSDHPR
jgi:hypothetical protein